MKLYMPTYCKDFKCIADKCSDNCCIGWEIDIDCDTLRRYENIDTPFGARLKESIDKQGTPHFILKKDERCAFLNKNNLCDIITNLGEGYLCQICRDHPRYFNWYEDFMEGGIGLCCEEAARLILTSGKFELYATERQDLPGDEYDKDTMQYLKRLRQDIICLFENENLSLSTALSSALRYAKNAEGDFDDDDSFTHDTAETFTALLTLLKDLEPISSTWSEFSQSLFSSGDELLKQIHAFDDNKKVSAYLKNIAVYFIWRYFLCSVYTGEVYGAVFLMCVSVMSISAAMSLHILSGNELTQEKAVEIAKDFSKQIEYSEDNLNLIFDAAYESEKLSVSNVLRLLQK